MMTHNLIVNRETTDNINHERFLMITTARVGEYNNYNTEENIQNIYI